LEKISDFHQTRESSKESFHIIFGDALFPLEWVHPRGYLSYKKLLPPNELFQLVLQCFSQRYWKIPNGGKVLAFFLSLKVGITDDLSYEGLAPSTGSESAWYER
jgi:hypothetical protein